MRVSSGATPLRHIVNLSQSHACRRARPRSPRQPADLLAHWQGPATRMTRREFFSSAGAAALLPGCLQLRAAAVADTPPDHTIEIAPCTLDLSPRRSIKTIGYNGQIPGPLLRLREGSPTTIRVINRTPDPEIVHLHGLHLPVPVDGAMEEGSPMIAPGASTLLRFTPTPAGFRWYHTHTSAGSDLKKAQYSGQHGFLLVEPASHPGAFDQEVFLALHDWEGQLLGSDDGSMNPVYEVSTVNGRVLGAADPIRVRPGARVLFHILNSSPTEVHWISLSGHTFHVVALDGNPVPNPAPVPMLRLAPAERVCALVEMNNPGVWVLGEVRKHIQAAGMGIALEYTNASGRPRWQQPPALLWNYEQFGRAPDTDAPPAAEEIPLLLDSKFQGHGAMERWRINGESYPETDSPILHSGQRYRLRFINKSLDPHPMHLHRHTFQLITVPSDAPGSPARPTRGILKDTLLVPAGSESVVEFVANNPGNTLLHCHQQNHMDLGFMMVFRYA